MKKKIRNTKRLKVLNVGVRPGASKSATKCISLKVNSRKTKEANYRLHDFIVLYLYKIKYIDGYNKYIIHVKYIKYVKYIIYIKYVKYVKYVRYIRYVRYV